MVEWTYARLVSLCVHHEITELTASLCNVFFII